jgi:hypothetical protein
MKAIFGLIAALAVAAPALAQEAPGGVPLGAGTQLGVEQLNNSGQAGYVTFFHHGASTEMVTEILGAPAGRSQTIAIQRGKGCTTIQPGFVAKGADLHNGRSRGTIPISEPHLLSGNYVFVVYSSDMAGARPVACAHLYQ